MIEPRKEDEMDPVAAEIAGLGNRVSVVEVKLDGLSTKLDEGFKQVDRRFEKVDDRFEKVDEEFKALRSELKSDFDRIQRTLFLGATGIIAALITAPHL